MWVRTLYSGERRSKQKTKEQRAVEGVLEKVGEEVGGATPSKWRKRGGERLKTVQKKNSKRIMLSIPIQYPSSQVIQYNNSRTWSIAFNVEVSEWTGFQAHTHKDRGRHGNIHGACRLRFRRHNKENNNVDGTKSGPRIGATNKYTKASLCEWTLSKYSYCICHSLSFLSLSRSVSER